VLSLLILTIVVQKQAQMVRQIVAPATLARYFDALLALLAARAQVVLGEHVASLDAADSTSLKDVDVRAPHYVRPVSPSATDRSSHRLCARWRVDSLSSLPR